MESPWKQEALLVPGVFAFCGYTWGTPGVPILRAILFGVYMGAPDFWKPPVFWQVLGSYLVLSGVGAENREISERSRIYIKTCVPA